MPVSIKHATLTVLADDGVSPVGADEWNADHAITGLGTAADYNIGTSGATIPLLNGTNVFSGDVSINKTSPTLSFLKTASGQDAALYSYNGSLGRWGLFFGDAVAESGSNAGSNLL